MKKSLIPLAAAVVLGATLTACGSSAEGQSGGPVTLTFQHQFSDTESELITTLVEEYEDLNPDVKVELVRDNDASYYDKLVTQITAGRGPDIVRLEPPKVSQYAASGFLAPVDDALGRPEDFFANTIAAATLDGKVYGVPQDVSTLALFYRKDMLEEAGIAKPPATWEELETSAAALTGDGIYGIGLFGGWGAYEFYPWLWQAGAEVLNEDGTEAVFNSEAGVEALTLWADLQKTAMPDGMATATEDDVRGPFVNGDLAMFTSGPYMTSILADSGLSEDQWAVAPLPAGEVSASVLGGMDLSVLENSDNKEDAIEFLTWLSSDEIQTRWADELNYVPAKKSLYEAEPFASDPNVATFGAIIESSKSRPTVARAADVDAALGGAVAAALSGAASPEDAMNKAADEANAALAE